ncbi:MAG TPA: hypothetical protein VGN32_15105, partial [Ktedonobacterales bacterium]|nr:hypothetical protein [Ktedonobacterales bacterium]
IAEAVEISPSTFFRYFPTKEDVALYDDLDPLMFAEFEAQPAELSPIQALRAALRAVFARLPAMEMQQQWERSRLILAVPELRMRVLDQFAGLIQVVADVMARRLGRSADDLAVRMFAGAVIGVVLAALFAVADDPAADFMALVDVSLAYLEAGLPL